MNAEARKLFEKSTTRHTTDFEQVQAADSLELAIATQTVHVHVLLQVYARMHASRSRARGSIDDQPIANAAALTLALARLE
jgi:hypothetical protein